MKSFNAKDFCEPSQAAISNEEQRHSPRIIPSAPTSVKLHPSRGKVIQGMLQDESDDGLGVLVDAQPELKVGQRLRIILRDNQVAAEVRRVTARAEGGFVVGLRLQH